MTTYPGQHDAHVGTWLKHKFNITVEWMYHDYVAYEGDLDVDTPLGHSDTRFGAAQDYACSYDINLANTLERIEHGTL